VLHLMQEKRSACARRNPTPGPWSPTKFSVRLWLPQTRELTDYPRKDLADAEPHAALLSRFPAVFPAWEWSQCCRDRRRCARACEGRISRLPRSVRGSDCGWCRQAAATPFFS